MPLIDVSEIIFDADFAASFNVIRKAEVVGTNGRASVTETRFDGQTGVIINTDPADLEPQEEGEMAPRVVTIVTQFRLRGPAPGFQPDDVEIDGERMKVIKVIPHTRWGSGFVKAVAQSIATIPAAPV